MPIPKNVAISTKIAIGGTKISFFEEFIPAVEKKYRIKGEKRYRAVAGLSMGGGGSSMYALHHPEFFSSACPLSAYVGPLTIDDLKECLKDSDFTYGQTEMKIYFKQHNALELLKTVPSEDFKSVRWYIDRVDDGFLFEGNSLMHIAMKKKRFRLNTGYVMVGIAGRTGGHRFRTYFVLFRMPFIKIEMICN